jgi:hypothetical protein
MQTKRVSLFFAVSIATIFAMSFSAAPALGQDPLIGTWNLHGANLDGSSPFIAVMTFNAGGTTVEFDTAGTNSSASPGESIVLGKWSQTAVAKYTFKEQNYVYDQSGSLTLIAIAGCKLDLASNMKHVRGPCTLSFYQCSVKQCPGSLVAGPIAFKVSGKRF